MQGAPRRRSADLDRVYLVHDATAPAENAAGSAAD